MSARFGRIGRGYAPSMNQVGVVSAGVAMNGTQAGGGKRETHRITPPGHWGARREVARTVRRDVSSGSEPAVPHLVNHLEVG